MTSAVARVMSDDEPIWTPTLAWAMATASLVPSPQKRTTLPCAIKSCTYFCLSAGDRDGAGYVFHDFGSISADNVSLNISPPKLLNNSRRFVAKVAFHAKRHENFRVQCNTEESHASTDQLRNLRGLVDFKPVRIASLDDRTVPARRNPCTGN